MAKLIRVALISAALGFSFASIIVREAVADAPQDCLNAYKRADYPTALNLCRSAAAHGNAVGQLVLGTMYFSGNGIAQDLNEAAKLFRLAAAQGVALAQYQLAVMYENGQGMARDYVRSYVWYKMAADQGDANAIDDLGGESDLLTPAQLVQAQAMAAKCKASNFKDCD